MWEDNELLFAMVGTFRNFRFVGMKPSYNQIDYSGGELCCKVTGRTDCPYLTKCSAYAEAICRDHVGEFEDE